MEEKKFKKLRISHGFGSTQLKELLSSPNRGFLVQKSKFLNIFDLFLKSADELGVNFICLNAALLPDPKILLGSYSIHETAGNFVWKQGILIQALKSGHPILLDDIHMANSELLVIVHQIISNGFIFDSYLSERISAHPDFKIFASLNEENSNSHLQYQIKAFLWDSINLDIPSSAEQYILSSCGGASKEILEYLAQIRHLIEDIDQVKLFKYYSNSSRCFCTNTLYERDRVLIFQIAYAYFCSIITDIARKKDLETNMCFLLHLPPPDFRLCLEEESVSFGSITVRKMGKSREQSETYLPKLAHLVLSSMFVSLDLKEPALLVGETGTGKTTLVQFLASLVGANLIVFNLSQQTESQDLLGGYRPISEISIMKRLYRDFCVFFTELFSFEKNIALFNSLSACINSKNTDRFFEIIHITLKKIGDDSICASFVQTFEAHKRQLEAANNGSIFFYEEGFLLRAIREGSWVLLDEINLAPTEVLQVIYGICANKDNVEIVSECGSRLQIAKHPNFRLFACMNPATDFCKKNLPQFLKDHFIEIYVDEIDSNQEDFVHLISKILGKDYSHNYSDSPNIVSSIYQSLKRMSQDGLIYCDTGRRPLFNLRSLSRVLKYSAANARNFGEKRALYEGFLMSFVSSLDDSCQDKCIKVLRDRIYQGDNIPKLRNAMSCKEFIIYKGYHIRIGASPLVSPQSLEEDYIFTPSVENHMKNLARSISAQFYPILLEGPTSSGKTSSIYFLAKYSGNTLIRINNHEHTELSEYIGSYSVDQNDGSLYFKEGILVEALKCGHWLLLDELNLAPSEVLEALNRLLDDNRELMIPETGDVIKPHPNFMLFATQNPAGSLYGGRKHLSRAFRSRFLEIKVPSIPSKEMQTILTKKCKIAPSQAKKLTTVYEVLQEKRTATGNVFAGRHALITLRDLFRWASRKHNLNEDLAMNGIAIIYERARTVLERHSVIQAIQTVFKTDISILIDYKVPRFECDVSWTSSMVRLFDLCLKCIENKEPILLIGETGCGKTTVCQILSKYLSLPLTSLSCHQNMETSDFMGTFRPCRDRSAGKLFEFYEGPLISSMKNGGIFLMDEISLAEDSVLEALNSLLEPARTVTMTEGFVGQVKAVDNFIFISTMNPGGDYGKKELSPALRSRFTEIWVPDDFHKDDILAITEKELGYKSERISEIFMWLKTHSPKFNIPVSLRDLTNFLNFLKSKEEALMEGLEMLFFDRNGADELKREFCKAFDFAISDSCADSFEQMPERFGIRPYYYKGPLEWQQLDTCFTAPTTLKCARRILRALSIRKPILLEGPPGVGKTTIITSLAQAAGHSLFRFNFSEQTDLSDLFGSELPVPRGKPGEFYWVDGPLLNAIKSGDWVLLDEINLASQSVLEGLNAILDHRGEAYIPELDRSFKLNANTKIFAAQNPVFQGGNRKSLPKSFLNRFTVVWFSELNPHDYKIILKDKFPLFPTEFINNCVEFIEKLGQRSQSMAGGPWEVNLRDLFRWLRHSSDYSLVKPFFATRFRTQEDRKAVLDLFSKIFSHKVNYHTEYSMNPQMLKVGSATYPIINSNALDDFKFLSFELSPLEALIHSVNANLLSILTGSSGSGKTALIGCLANLNNVTVDEVSLTPESDTMDLLGTFSQFDFDLSLRRLCERAGIITSDLHQVTIRDFVGFPELEAEFEYLVSIKETASGRFEWHDGPLVSALLKGHWLVFSQANLANSAVLDRLNSLFEPNGLLYLPEQGGLPDGSVRIIKPHPQFRAFMSYDPKFGEISRAMRNRGVEVFIDIRECDYLDQLKLKPQSEYNKQELVSLREIDFIEQNEVTDRVMDLWREIPHTRPLCKLDVATLIKGHFDPRLALFFEDHSWDLELMLKDEVFAELVSAFRQESLVSLALFWFNHLDVRTQAPYFYETWLHDYRPLLKSNYEALFNCEHSKCHLEKYIDILATDFLNSDKLATFSRFSEIYSTLDLEELILFSKQSGLKKALESFIVEARSKAVSEIPVFLCEIKTLVCKIQSENASNVSLVGFPDYDLGLMKSLAFDPNEVWDGRLLARQCIYNLFQEELFLRKAFLYYYLGSKIVSLSQSETAIVQLEQSIERLRKESIERDETELGFFLHKAMGVAHFLRAESNLKQLLEIRSSLWTNLPKSCLDLCLLLCAHLDSYIWQKVLQLPSSSSSIPLCKLSTLVWLSNSDLGPVTHLLAKSLPASKPTNDNIYYYKEDSHEDEEQRIIDEFLSHKEDKPFPLKSIWNLLVLHSQQSSRMIRDYFDLAMLDVQNPELIIPDCVSKKIAVKYLRTFDVVGDFYSSVKLQALNSKIPFLRKLVTASTKLLEEYPNHDVLLEVTRLSEELLGSNYSRHSMISVLLCVERILSKSEDWQKLADKSRKLPTADIVEWVLEWRREEVVQWPNLFASVSCAFEEKAILEGGLLANVLMRAEPHAEVISIVDAFLLSCPAGEFGHRLSMIDQLSRLLIPSASLLHVIHAYYKESVLPKVSFHLEREKAPIEKELKLFAQTVAFNDHNLFAIQASIKKSHSALARILKKFRDTLQRPVSSILSLGIDVPFRSDAPVLQTKSSTEKTQLLAESVHSMSAPLANLIDAIKVNLQEIPTSSMQNKQNTLVALFKLLKSIGLKPYKKIPEGFSLPKALLAVGSNAIEESLCPYFVKCIAKWNDLEMLAMNPHQDVSPREIEIIKNMSYQLVATICSFDKFPDFRKLGHYLIDCEWAAYDHPDSIVGKIEESCYDLANASLVDECNLALLDDLKELMSNRFVVGHQLILNKRLVEKLSSNFEYFKDFSSFEPIMNIPEIEAALSVIRNQCQEALGLSGEELDESGFASEHLTIVVSKLKRCLELLDSAACLIVKKHVFLSVSRERIRELFESLSLLHSNVVLAISTISHLSSVLFNVFSTLLRQGYCRPSDAPVSDDAKLDDGKLEGTGMADGTGERNVSKEMEFEEQVTDLQGQEDEAKETDGEGKDDEAIDQDFQGALKDLLDGDEENSSDEKSQEEEEPIEEGDNEDKEGDINEVDPNWWNDSENKETCKDLSQKGEKQLVGEEPEAQKDAEQIEPKDPKEQQASEQSDSEAKLEEELEEIKEPEPKEISDEEEEFELPEQMDIDDGQESSQEVGQEDNPENEAENKEELAEDLGEEANEDIAETELPPQHTTATDTEAIPEEQLNVDESGNFIGNQDSTQQPQEQQKQTLSAAGSGRNMGGVIESKKTIRAEDRFQGVKAEAVYRSLHDILKEEMPYEPSQTNQNVSQAQQFTQADNRGLAVLASGSGGSFETVEEQQEYEQDLDQISKDKTDQEEGEYVKQERANDLDEQLCSNPSQITEAMALKSWKEYKQNAELESSNLCEQLRLILVPTVAARLKGDYKSGKRINIKRILPFVASGYRRDKIWLRRNRLSNRDYRITMAIDNSKSMQTGAAGDSALEAAAIISGALEKLETGTAFSVLSFGNQVKIIENMEAEISTVFTFDEEATNLEGAMDLIGGDLLTSSSESSTPHLSIYISDGLCSSSLADLKHKVHQQRHRNIISLFIIIDAQDGRQSITELTKVERDPLSNKLIMKNYLEEFPFDYYVVVRDLKLLPDLVSDALRQWFRSLEQIN